MKINFCTFFDKENISRFIALKESLDQFNLDYRFYVLCLDDYTVDFFKNNFFKNLKIITFKEVKKKFPILNVLKNDKDIRRYYSQIFAFLIKYIYVIKKEKQISFVYANCFFYKNPEKIILSNMDASILILRKNNFKKYGNFNINFICFNFDFKETKTIVNELISKCINDFKNLKANISFIKFKHLDNWVSKLKYIRVFQPEYTCLSPLDNNLTVEQNINSMLMFHFDNLKINYKSYSTGFYILNKKNSKKIIKNLYEPYVNKLNFLEKKYNLEFTFSSNYKKNILNKLISCLGIFFLLIIIK